MRTDPRPTKRRHQRRRVGIVAVATVFVAAAAYNGIVLSEQHRSEATLHATELGVKKARAMRSKLTAEVASTIGARDARQEARARTTAEIATAEASLQSASAVNGLQSIDIGELRACLTGVSNAVNALQSSNLPARGQLDRRRLTQLPLAGRLGRRCGLSVQLSRPIGP